MRYAVKAGSYQLSQDNPSYFFPTWHGMDDVPSYCSGGLLSVMGGVPGWTSSFTWFGFASLAAEIIWENVLKMDKGLESALQPLGAEQLGKDCWQAIMATGWLVNEEENRAESSVVPGGNTLVYATGMGSALSVFRVMLLSVRCIP